MCDVGVVVASDRCLHVSGHCASTRLHMVSGKSQSQDTFHYSISEDGSNVVLSLENCDACVSYDYCSGKLATCMGIHERLGSCSPLSCLTSHVLELIWDYVPCNPDRDDVMMQQKPWPSSQGECEAHEKRSDSGDTVGLDVAKVQCASCLGMLLSPPKAAGGPCLVRLVAEGTASEHSHVPRVIPAKDHGERCGGGFRVVSIKMPKGASLW
jgi:hypothetical protein